MCALRQSLAQRQADSSLPIDHFIERVSPFLQTSLMSGLLSLLVDCFASCFITKSHPLKRYRDRLVGQEGVLHLNPAFVPTKKNGRRLLIVGDVHGCLEELRHLLKKCEFDPRKDHIIFVGDLVAKGPFSLETLTFVDELAESASSVRGNHDDKLMQWNAYLNSKSTHSSDNLSDESLPDGLSRRDEHRFLAKNLETNQINLLESLPYIIRIPMPKREYLVVHAGLLPGRALHRQKCWDVSNMRNIEGKKAIDDRNSGEGWFHAWHKEQEKLTKKKRQVIIYGHDAGRDLNLRKYSRGLDSRCVRGGVLTAMVISGGDGEKYVHVKARRRYD